MKKIIALFLLLSSPAFAQTTVTMGDTAVEVAADNGNGNLVVAQQATLAQAGALQSLSFYVTAAAGQMYLAVFSDNGGKPGTLLAQTAVFAPVTGWNNKPTLSAPSLSAGTYWLIYAPSSNSLAFRKQNNSGTCFYFNRTFQALPTSWPTAGVNNCTPTTWSFYATLTTAPPPPPPPPPSPPQTVFTGPYAQQGGSSGTATCTEVDTSHLNCVLNPPLVNTNDLTVGPVQ